MKKVRFNLKKSLSKLPFPKSVSAATRDPRPTRRTSRDEEDEVEVRTSSRQRQSSSGVRKFFEEKNTAISITAVLLVLAASLFASNYFARNSGLQRDDLTPEERNLSEQLDRQNDNQDENKSATSSADTKAGSPSATPTAGKDYTVQQGDSLSLIAQTVYGDPNKYTEIAKANNVSNPNVIEPGQKLKLPAKEAVQASTPMQNQKVDTEHLVVRGETLWSLAEKYYGSGFEWYRIRDANADKVQYFADRKPWIEIGVRLKIPLSNSVTK